MKLKKNGGKSCGDKSRHIDIRYFFIKDVLHRKNINLQYCPTDDMVADFYTKPLQGSLFKKMRDFTMGHSDSLNVERVDNSAFSENCESRMETSTGKQDSQLESECIKISYPDVVKGNNDHKDNTDYLFAHSFKLIQ